MTRITTTWPKTRIPEIRTLSITLTQGKVTLVDADDFEWISRLKAYAAELQPGRFVAIVGLFGKGVYLHRAIMRPPQNLLVDHINHDPLDNRKANLRVCTAAENAYNRRRHKNCTSRFKGVSIEKRSQRWRAQIGGKKTKRIIGSFDCEIEAAKAYNKAALEMFGDYAYLNKIDEVDQ